MNVQEILRAIDVLYEKKRPDTEIAMVLKKAIDAARQEDDKASLVTLLNEAVGFYRDRDRFEECFACCEAAAATLRMMGMADSVPYATTLLNTATAYRAAGRLDDAARVYAETEALYQKHLAPTDYLYAGLHNNVSLLHQKRGAYDQAAARLRQAIGIISAYPEAKAELATSYANLASVLLKTANWREAEEPLLTSLRLFTETGETERDYDFHYSFALASLAEYLFRCGEYREAEQVLMAAIKRLRETVGETADVRQLEANLREIRAALADNSVHNLSGQSLDVCGPGMALSKAYFQRYGVPMLDAFGAVGQRVAAGLAGEGSECFGFDDELSRDHDFGPGFCVWLTDEDYAEYGEAMRQVYERLPKTLAAPGERLHTTGVPEALWHLERIPCAEGAGRVGVMRIDDFYHRLLGMKKLPETEEEWLYVREDRLAAAVNGCVFHDPTGVFSGKRERLKAYYPERVFRKRLAQELTLASQNGQYNYPRMLTRGDKAAALIALGDFTKHFLRVLFLLNRTYAPHDKWLYRGALNLPKLADAARLTAVAAELTADPANHRLEGGQNAVTGIIEAACMLVAEELYIQGISDTKEAFLAEQGRRIGEKK